MTNDKSIKLTNTVYKILEFFPESDPLKNRAKDKALVIMDNLALVNENSGWASFQKEKIKVQLLEDINTLLGYLWIGKSQGWLNSGNCLIISNEYEKIKKEIKPIIELARSEIPAPQEFPITTQKLPIVDSQPTQQKIAKIETENKLNPVLNNIEPQTFSFSLSGRQGKILEFLSKNEKAQVMNLQTILPDVTKRTIRRDLDELLQAGKIIRSGEFNEIFYKIA